MKFKYLSTKILFFKIMKKNNKLKIKFHLMISKLQ